MTERIKKLAEGVKEFLNQVYDGKIKEVILYGSYARAQAGPDSDVDLLVVVDNSLKPFEVRNRLSDFLFALLMEQRELISVIVIPESFFQNYHSPFIANVKEEGIRI